MKMTALERKKLLTPITWFFLFIVMLIKVLIHICTPEREYVFSKERYRTYIETIQGYSQNEQTEWITAEHERLNLILSQQDVMLTAYTNGEISLQTYNDYQKDFLKAQSEKPAFDAVMQKHEYYLALESEGKSTEYFYDLAIIDYLLSLCKPDYAYIAFLIFAIVNTLAMDRECKMYEMVTVTAHGRVDRYKLCAIIQTVLCTFLFSAAVDLGLYMRYAHITLLQVDLYNMEIFSACRYPITVAECICLVLAVKLLWSIALGVFVYLVYKVVKNKVIALFITYFTIFLPILFADKSDTRITQWLIGV